jgi:hypothetical protein
MQNDKKAYSALRRVVIYLAPHESKHFEEMGRPRQHIYRDVRVLARFLDANAPERRKRG